MKPATGRDGAVRMGTVFVRNFPVALLLCIGYFVFFVHVWGPITTWKWAVASVLLVGLSLTLRMHYPGREARARRRRQRPGGYEAAANADWPIWRRVAAVVTGSLLCLVGFYQSLGIEVDLSYYPLISGLCLILSFGIGVTLVAWGWPRARWKRGSLRRPQPARPRRVPDGHAPTPANAGDRSSTLRVSVPRETGLSGVWGGFGTRPAAEIWTPGGATPAADPEPVPARFRSLRLLRRSRPRAGRSSRSIVVLLVLAGAVLLALFLYLLARGSP